MNYNAFMNIGIFLFMVGFILFCAVLMTAYLKTSLRLLKRCLIMLIISPICFITGTILICYTMPVLNSV